MLVTGNGAYEKEAAIVKIGLARRRERGGGHRLADTSFPGSRALVLDGTKGLQDMFSAINSVGSLHKRSCRNLGPLPKGRYSELRWDNMCGDTCNCGNGFKIDNYLVAMVLQMVHFEGTVVEGARGPLFVDGWKLRGKTLPRTASEHFH